MLLLLFAAFGVAAVAGALVGRWWFVSIVALVLTLIGLFLWANDDWYGAGRGDFGIELNLSPASVPPS